MISDLTNHKPQYPLGLKIMSSSSRNRNIEFKHYATTINSIRIT